MNGAVSVGHAATPSEATPSEATPSEAMTLDGASSEALPEIVTGVHNDPHRPVVLTVVIATYNRLNSLLWLLDDLSAQTAIVGFRHPPQLRERADAG